MNNIPCHTNYWRSTLASVVILVSFLFGQPSFASAETVMSNEVKVFVTPQVTCSASSPVAGLNQSVTWQATVTPSGSFYTYQWSGTDTLTGSSASVSKTYATHGVKSATVTVTPTGTTAGIPDISSISAPCTVTIADPDLTSAITVAGTKPLAGSPDTYLEGGTITLGGTIYNIHGTGGTIRTITNEFSYKIENSPWFSISTFGLPALNALASANAIAPPAISPIGTTNGIAYTFRLCADTPQNQIDAPQNPIVERHQSHDAEADNCAEKTVIIRTGVDSPDYRLTASVTGNGMITSASGGISCGVSGTICTKLFGKGSTVVLTATPSEGNRFLGWGGDCSVFAQNATCTVSMDADKTVSATFQQRDRVRDTGEAPAGVCYASPTDRTVNQSVNWFADPDENFGTPPYTLTWTGEPDLVTACNRLPNGCTSTSYGEPHAFDMSYSNAGTKKGSVRIADLEDQYVNVACSTDVTVTPPPPPSGFWLEADPAIIKLSVSNKSETRWSQTTRLFITSGEEYNGTPELSLFEVKDGSTILDDIKKGQIDGSQTGSFSSNITIQTTPYAVTYQFTNANDSEFTNEFPSPYGKSGGIDFFVETNEFIPAGDYLLIFTAIGSPSDTEEVILRVDQSDEAVITPPPTGGQPSKLPVFEEF